MLRLLAEKPWFVASTKWFKSWKVMIMTDETGKNIVGTRLLVTFFTASGEITITVNDNMIIMDHFQTHLCDSFPNNNESIPMPRSVEKTQLDDAYREVIRKTMDGVFKTHSYGDPVSSYKQDDLLGLMFVPGGLMVITYDIKNTRFYEIPEAEMKNTATVYGELFRLCPNDIYHRILIPTKGE